MTSAATSPKRPWRSSSQAGRMRTALVIAATPLTFTLLIGAGFGSDGEAPPEAGINSAALPPLARQLLPQLGADLASECPDLPVLWVLAETQAESGWNPR